MSIDLFQNQVVAGWPADAEREGVFIDIRLFLDTCLLIGILGDTCPAITVGESVSIDSSNIVMRHDEFDCQRQII